MFRDLAKGPVPSVADICRSCSSDRDRNASLPDAFSMKGGGSGAIEKISAGITSPMSDLWGRGHICTYLVDLADALLRAEMQ